MQDKKELVRAAVCLAMVAASASVISFSAQQDGGGNNSINPSSAVVYVSGRDKIRTYRLNMHDGQLVQAGPDFEDHGAGIMKLP